MIVLHISDLDLFRSTAESNTSSPDLAIYGGATVHSRANPTINHH